MKASTYTILGGLVVVFLAIFLVLRPTIFGNVIGWAEEKEGLLDSISNLNQTISTCNELNKEISAEFETAKEDLTKSQNELAKFKKECADDKKELNEKYDDLEAEYKDFKTDSDKVIENSARSICCKAKIDNMNINYYDIEDSKIVCLESGDKELKCW